MICSRLKLFLCSFKKAFLSCNSFVQKLVQDDMLKPAYKKDYRDMYLHAIRSEEVMRDLTVSSKFDTSWSFLVHLRDLGRDCAKVWFEKNFDKVGKQSTVDIMRDYLAPKKSS